jgi:hypothetical protein
MSDFDAKIEEQLHVATAVYHRALTACHAEYRVRKAVDDVLSDLPFGPADHLPALRAQCGWSSEDPRDSDIRDALVYDYRFVNQHFAPVTKGLWINALSAVNAKHYWTTSTFLLEQLLTTVPLLDRKKWIRTEKVVLPGEGEASTVGLGAVLTNPSEAPYVPVLRLSGPSGVSWSAITYMQMLGLVERVVHVSMGGQ